MNRCNRVLGSVLFSVCVQQVHKLLLVSTTRLLHTVHRLLHIVHTVHRLLRITEKKVHHWEKVPFSR